MRYDMSNLVSACTRPLKTTENEERVPQRSVFGLRFEKGVSYSKELAKLVLDEERTELHGVLSQQVSSRY